MNSLCFFQKKVLFDVRFEIHLVRRNIASTRQSVRAFKKLYSGLHNGSICQNGCSYEIRTIQFPSSFKHKVKCWKKALKLV